uniref:1-Cys peroxiredoxin n=1 Tax=Hirondellea gigas TaxID=1518452 RepID=A0A6A7G9G6_9CRUS
MSEAKAELEKQQTVRIGDIAPNFSAKTTKGDISLHEYLGDSWGVLFSHPADFTPVCTTELGRVAQLKSEWAKRNVKPIGYSVNSLESHGNWIKDINETQNCVVDYPLIDGSDKSVALRYGMLDPDEVDKAGMPLTVRSVFVIDPNKKVRMILTYPAATGRNFDEILRVIDSLQMTSYKKLATPADWKKGDSAVILPNVSNEEAEKLFPGYTTVKPYLRTTTKY